MKSRFECPSGLLSPRLLLRRMRRGLWSGLAFALAAHVGLAQMGRSGEEQKPPKPLTTQFVKRQPRLTKPLELKKRPAPRRRNIRRTMVAVQARADRQQTVGALDASRTTQRLAHPRVSVGRAIPFQDASLEPRSVARRVEGEKEDKGIVDMSLELLDIYALDTGRYHALVIQDPREKKGIKGYLHLASAYPATGWNAADRTVRQEIEVWGTILRALVEAMNRFTDIRTDFYGKVTFDSSDLFKLPFIFNRVYWPCRLDESEASNFGQYLVQGGFLFAETLHHGAISSIGFLPGEATIKRMVQDALETQKLSLGEDWGFEKLPNTHGLYHCYFDFDGPPVGNDYYSPAALSYLEGVTLGGRLFVVVGQKNYASSWVDWPQADSRRDNTRQLQFAVNMIVFALTQEGSITHRLMESIR
jgi:hypothetical protein